MRPPNRSRPVERASLRIRSHSFAGLAPPAYEEVESLPLRSTSTLAIPAPSYEEATGSASQSYLTLQPAEEGQGSLSVISMEEGSQATHHRLQQEELQSHPLEEPGEDEDTDSEGPTIVIHPREPFLPTITASSSFSSIPSRPNALPRPDPPAEPHFCLRQNRKVLRIFIFITLTSIYGILLYFYLKPVVHLLEPDNIQDSSTVTFFFIMFAMPVVTLFFNLKYSELWVGK